MKNTNRSQPWAHLERRVKASESVVVDLEWEEKKTSRFFHVHRMRHTDVATVSPFPGVRSLKLHVFDKRRDMRTMSHNNYFSTLSEKVKTLF